MSALGLPSEPGCIRVHGLLAAGIPLSPPPLPQLSTGDKEVKSDISQPHELAAQIHSKWQPPTLTLG